MKVMNDSFKDFTIEFVAVHLVEIFINSNSRESHKKAYKTRFGPTSEHKLCAQLSKCKFGVQEIEYLGPIFEEIKYAMNPNKTKSIEPSEKPTSMKNSLSFLISFKYNRQFIKDCSKIAKPLTKSTKKMGFSCSESAQSAFEELKRQ